MFSVIISEKGGAERRESFDRTEINVGRVQGNDLMLPKGNVSKRHARLLYRDGRFIVTDLKSTNGTYVNGRKIAQATIVREGDKIYIGDFVLRIESSSAAGAPAPTGGSISVDETPPPDVAGPPSPPGANTSAQIPVAAFIGDPTRGPGYPEPAQPAGGQTNPPAQPRAGSAPSLPAYEAAARPIPPARVPSPYDQGPDAQRRSQGHSSDAPTSQPASSVEKGLRTPGAPRIEPKGDANQIISHFPLENDPDESQLYNVPGPPRVPSAARPPPPQPLPQSPPPRPVPVAQAPRPVPVTSGAADRLGSASPGATTPSVGAPAPPPVYPGAQGAQPVERSTSPSVGMAQGLGLGTPQPPQPPPLAPMGSGTAITASSPAYEAGVPPKPPLVPMPPAYEGSAPGRPGSAPMAPISAISSSGPGVLTPPSPAVGTGRLAMPPARLEPEAVEPSRVAAQRAALAALIDRVGEVVDLRLLDSGAPPDDATASRIERAIGERAAAMRAHGEIRPEIDADALVAGARRELLEHGPLTPLLEDEDVSEIYVTRHDYVLAMHGKRQVPAEIGFSSERSLGRVLRRICAGTGRPIADGEVFVERRLARGARLFAVLPTAPDQGHLLVVRKPQRADLTLEDLVRSGTISRAMAGLLGQCIEARANILVTGAASAGATTLLGALAAAGSTTDRVVVLQEDDELIFNQPHTVSLLLGETPEENARAVQAAARLRPDRLVVGAFAGRVAAEVVDAMGDGADGVLAASRAPTLRQAVARLTADLAATKIGLTVDVAHEWLASSFDLAIEIAQLRDGRRRVLRIAELGVDDGRIAIRDIFSFAVERTAAGGAIEGSFHPTGVIPAIVEDLAARGVSLDPSIFKRHRESRP